jgi:hypothetical protein
MKHEFSKQIFEKYSNFTKIRPMGADLLRADERTQRRTDGRADIMKLTAASRNFENSSKHCWDPTIRKCTINLKDLTIFLYNSSFRILSDT